MFDPESARHDDLRGGTPPWGQDPQQPVKRAIEKDFRCEVLVVGAGITGSLAAEHLMSQGRDVCIIDRQRPALGSTLASTAMLLWEIDRSLTVLTDIYGFERAANIYRRSVSATNGLIELVTTQALPCALRRRHSLYLAANEVGERELLAEHHLRKRAGLPGDFLDHRGLAREFDFPKENARRRPGI